MGSSTSKPQEVKTFIPQTPVEFSSSLLQQLENSTESDYTRSQYAETYIQQRVSDELKKLQKESVQSLNEKLNQVPETDSKLDLSTGNANEKLDSILQNLQKLNSLKPQLDDNLQKSKASVLSCLKENAGKPLNCWNEVENFKKLINDL